MAIEINVKINSEGIKKYISNLKKLDDQLKKLQEKALKKFIKKEYGIKIND